METTNTLRIPEEQWELPVSRTPDGHWVTLREWTAQSTATLSWTPVSKHLPPDQQAALAAERIAHRPDFQVAMIGLGVVNQERALQEIKAQTPPGRALIEIELRTVARVIKRVCQG